MSTKLHLSLRLEGPLQSWGYEDRYNNRGTGLLPTKSGVLGICCAAMGIARGSTREQQELPQLAALDFLSISGIPPFISTHPAQQPTFITRMQDYHTIKDSRTADGKIKDTHITYRTYLCDARNGAILSGDPTLLTTLAAALQNPVWGVWLGRKACIPSAPVFSGLHETESAALQNLLGEGNLTDYLHARDAAADEVGTDTLMDHPLTFAKSRVFNSRRIHLHRPGQVSF